MNKIILHPAYFGSILQFAVLAQATDIIFENEDNYQKQTYRTRQYIYGANGKLLLNIPIKHTKKGKRSKYKEIKIENEFAWQTNHWRSLEAAYRTSPFFEFYEDALVPLYEKKFDYLLDFNYACFDVICENLQLPIDFSKTTEYRFTEELPSEINDYRILIDAKTSHPFSQEKYRQVFEEKYGFIENLSIVDLLFNEGPNALNYLENQAIENIV